MQKVLGIAPISLGQWAAMMGLALGMMLAMELFKRTPIARGNGGRGSGTGEERVAA